MGEIPGWLQGLIATGVGAIVVFVLRSFFLQSTQAKWQASVDAKLDTIPKIEMKVELLTERFGTVKAQVDAVETRAREQATAHNASQQSLRSEILGRLKP